MMSDFTDEDVQRAESALAEYRPHMDALVRARIVGTILAAVLPEHDKRVRAEAYQEAADERHAISEAWNAGTSGIQTWLRARADAEESSRRNPGEQRKPRKIPPRWA